MTKSFTFIDLFAGIGGFHLAMESLGGVCVFASEIDPYARKTYEHNFKKISPQLFENHLFNDDIRKITPNDLPDFDVLCAGFPCQPFSQAGHRRGFDDNHNSERGNLFFNIVDILEAKKPKAFFLENVRGLVNHDNGKTLQIIQNILKEELGYSFYFKIVHASDYGLPQLRPRIFMIGFLNDHLHNGFTFPEKMPLKLTMSDVWGGKCHREIGFTLRVGGRGSKIDDRRNWDRYLVDGIERQLMPEQAKKMQGFPETFEFPVPVSQAMKQLGNSVAIDAVRACGKSLIDYLKLLENNEKKNINLLPQKQNKGEWTELYTFLKLLNDKKLYLANEYLEKNGDFFNVKKISTLNISNDYHLKEDSSVSIIDKNNKTNQLVRMDYLNDDLLEHLCDVIKSGKGSSFIIPEFDQIQENLKINHIKGTSYQKSDILLDINKDDQFFHNEGFGIKSYLGNKPTLLNASGNTNFIYKVIGLSSYSMDEINSIKTRTKLKDRIEKIYELGGNLVFDRIEKTTMQYNLDLVDSCIPLLLSKMLICFYKDRENNLEKNLTTVYDNYKQNFSTDLNGLTIKVKKLLIAILLGFFSGKKWNGEYSSNGIIVVMNDGDQLGYHITDLSSLENYLFNHIKFDTPSTTRHRYGSLFIENGQLYFKLNLQLRF